MNLWQENALNSVVFGCHPLAIFGIASKQNLIGTSIFVISTSNLEHG